MAGSRAVALVVALAMVTVSCGSGDNPVLATSSSSTHGGEPPVNLAGLADSEFEPAFLVVDEDPESPVSLIIGLAENDDGLESVVLLGPKLPSTKPPEAILVYVEGEAEPFEFAFDPEGRLQGASAPDGTELRVLSYQGNEATVAAIDPNGGVEVVTVEAPVMDTAILDSLGAGAGVVAQPAAYRAEVQDPHGPVPVLSQMVSTATASFGVNVSETPDLDTSDVLLRAQPNGCSVPMIANVPATSVGPYVTCRVTIGDGEVVVHSTVDVPALYGGEVPAIYWETREECRMATQATAVLGMLILVGSFLTLVVSAVAILAIGTLEGFVVIGGLGSLSSISNTVLGGAVIILSQNDCSGAFVTNEGLRRDVLERLEGVTATVTYTPILLREQERYQAVAEPAQLQFEPFGSGQPLEQELAPITVTVTDKEEADAEDDEGTLDGEYTGAFDWSQWGSLWASFSQNQIDITIQDSEVTALRISIDGVTNLAWDDGVTCNAPAGYEADVGPGVLRVDGTSITGDIQVRFYLGTPTGFQCDEQSPFDVVGSMSIDATIDGDTITGTLIGPCDDCDANIPLSFTAKRD